MTHKITTVENKNKKFVLNNVIVSIECNSLYIYRVGKTLTEIHLLYKELPHFIQNVLLSMLLHVNKTTKKCIQILVEYTHNIVVLIG
jgi:hypothetical protein